MHSIAALQFFGLYPNSILVSTIMQKIQADTSTGTAKKDKTKVPVPRETNTHFQKKKKKKKKRTKATKKSTRSSPPAMRPPFWSCLRCRSLAVFWGVENLKKWKKRKQRHGINTPQTEEKEEYEHFLRWRWTSEKKLFKVENNSLELTRIFKENIMTDCEREKKV